MRFETPTSFDEASRLLGAAETARILAGGTDLLVQMRSDRVQPDVVIDIKRIPGAADITAEAGGFRIGAAVPCIALGRHGPLVAAWPGVVEAANLIGSTQIQGRATMLGNLCNASPAADSVPAMIAAGAVVSVVGPNGAREIAAEDIAAGPGRTSLKAGELAASVFLPARPERSGDAYFRFTPRTEMDIAVVGAAVSLSFDPAGICTAARVGLGAVAATPLLVGPAADALIGTPVDAPALAALAAAASAACSPIDDKRGTVAFRTEVAGVLAKRAAIKAKERALGAA